MKNYKVLLTVISLVLILIFLHNKVDHLQENPFQMNFQFKNPALVAVNSKQFFCVVDDSGRRLVNVYNNEVLGTINGGKNSEETFSQCRDVAIDEENNIYIINMVLEKNGMQIGKENILKYNSKGEFISKIYEFTYNKEHQPSFLGWLLSLKIINNNLFFIYVENNTINIYKNSDNKVLLEKSFNYENANKEIISATLDENCNLYVTTKKGKILKLNKDTKIIYSGNGFNDIENNNILSVPWDLSIDKKENIYFTDIGSRNIKKISGNNVKNVIDIKDNDNFGDNPIYNRVKISTDGEILTTTDTHFWLVQDQNILKSYDSLSYSLKYFIEKYLVWLAFIIFICGIGFIFKKVWPLLVRYRFSSIEKNGIMIFFVAVIISLIVGLVLLTNSYKLLNKQIVNNISSMTDMVSAYADGDALERFKKLDDYNNADHQAFKIKLDKIIGKSYDNNDNFYYVIYKTDKHSVYQVMNYSNTFCPLTTLDTNYQGSYYQSIMESGSPIIVDEFKDSTGYWTYGVGPIYNSKSQIVGLVEIGRNLYTIKEEQKRIIINTIFDVITAIVVIFLLLTELLYFGEYLKKRYNQGFQSYDESVIGVVRPLSFILLVADFMQNSFTPIYVTSIYEPIFNLPTEIGIAIPLSAEVCTTAVFAWLAGNLKNKIGLKSLLFSGAGISFVGFIISAIIPNIVMFIIGKAIIGIGMGFIHVSLLTFISESEDEKTLSDGYAYYFAAYFAAINIGCIFGGVLANFIGQRQVYYVAAITIMIGSIIGVYLLQDMRINVTKNKNEHIEPEISLWRFLVDIRVMSFMLLIFIPYLIMSYFLYYFFPLFADQNHITTTRIAQAFLLNGIFVVYLGPLLAPKLEKIFSKKITMIIGSLLSIIAILLFVVWPSLTTAVIAIALLGVADSFTFTAQNIYYNTLDIVNKFGISKANGIKNTFENIGYIISPMIFGAAIIFGTSMGLMIISLMCLCLLCLFFVSIK